MTFVGLLLIAASSWALGTLVLARLDWADLRTYERVSLELLAGLGLTAILLSLLTLAGGFAWNTVMLAVISAAGLVFAWRDRRGHDGPQGPSRNRSADLQVGRMNISALAIVLVALLGCIGAIAPVTDDDALAYVVPISRHIAATGHLAVWPDQVRSMWPQSQQMLLAYLIALGGNRLGMLTALEFLLALGVASALARRACERTDHIPVALIIAFGAPVVAFQIASAKEDLLVVAATAATVVVLIGAARLEDFAIAGMFAGIAAGAKYPGAAIAVAAAAWPLAARQPRSLRHALVVAAGATVTGGLWYILNLWRYGNPVAPFLIGAQGTPLDAATVRNFIDGYGAGRSVTALVGAPIRIFLEPGLFCGRANLYNPLVYLALLGLARPSVRRRHAPLFFAAIVMYVVWFFGLQNARFLLPVAVLLAPAAADFVMTALGRWKFLLPVAWTAAVVSLGIVAAVGSVRAIRYVGNPQNYLERETQNYTDIEWMNTHLNSRTDRVASDHKVLAYLDTPWLILDPTYQIEIAASEMSDPERFLAACRRQGITHLFGLADGFADLRPHLRTIYQNPASRRGGVRFFREPPTEATAVFEIVGSTIASR